MKKRAKAGGIIIAMVLLFSLNFQANAQQPSGNQGSSIGQAIVINNVASLEDMEAKEQAYLEGKFGISEEDWELYEQVSLEQNSRHYDKITVKLAKTGELKTVYFDITQPFDDFNLLEE